MTLTLSDIVGGTEKEIILVYKDMGYEMEIEYADEYTIRLVCPDLEEELDG